MSMRISALINSVLKRSKIKMALGIVNQIWIIHRERSKPPKPHGTKMPKIKFQARSSSPHIPVKFKL